MFIKKVICSLKTTVKVLFAVPFRTISFCRLMVKIERDVKAKLAKKWTTQLNVQLGKLLRLF